MIESSTACDLIESELRHRRVVKAWLGYGDPMFLDFVGESQDRDDSPVASLHTNFAVWEVNGAVSANQERDAQPLLESACRSLIGASVQGVSVSSDGMLTIRFDESRALNVVPWPSTDGLSDAWCVGLCDDRILAVSNAGQFVIVNKDRPIREWFKPRSGQG